MPTYPVNLGVDIIRYNDYDGERSTVTINSALRSAANWDAQEALALALRDAIAGITRGLRVGFDTGNRYQTVNPGTKASDPLAQREGKWIVRFGNSNNKYRLEIPCPDLTKLDVDNRGYLDLDGTEGSAFRSGFEAYVVDEEGNAITIDTVKFVGRNI